MNYIFGVGSLIEQASRMRTTPAAMYVLPAVVKGFTGGWWARTGAIGFSTTFVGAVAEPSGSMNGVVYAVSDEELARTNKREAGYTPTDITDLVEILGGGFKPKAKSGSMPTSSKMSTIARRAFRPRIFQSCNRMREWSDYWENDRAYPRRAPFAVPLAQDIDNLLQKYLPGHFAKIRIAPGLW